ncbi:hypothetical protein MRX96_042581 [Rhipicephalus microplus]
MPQQPDPFSAQKKLILALSDAGRPAKRATAAALSPAEAVGTTVTSLLPREEKPATKCADGSAGGDRGSAPHREKDGKEARVKAHSVSRGEVYRSGGGVVAGSQAAASLSPSKGGTGSRRRVAQSHTRRGSSRVARQIRRGGWAVLFPLVANGEVADRTPLGRTLTLVALTRQNAATESVDSRFAASPGLWG